MSLYPHLFAVRCVALVLVDGLVVGVALLLVVLGALLLVLCLVAGLVGVLADVLVVGVALLLVDSVVDHL